jgi:hypothetical protein
MNDRQKLIKTITISIIICVAISTCSFFAGYCTGRADQKKYAIDNPGMQSTREREAQYLITINKLQELLGKQQTTVRYIEKTIKRINTNNTAIEKTNQIITKAAQRGVSSLETIRRAATSSYNIAGSLEMGNGDK